MRVIRDKIPFSQLHFDRLTSGLKQLHIDIPNQFTPSFFQSEIIKLISVKRLARIRFTAFRQDGGLYTATNNSLQFLITATPLQQTNYKLNKAGLSTGIFKDIPLAYSPLSPLKTINALPYVLASHFKKTIQMDDVLILNQQGRVAEASSSNVFIWTGKKLITPSLEEACVAGIIRRVLLENAETLGLTIEEGQITPGDIKKAKAVFLTNSIQGIKWVETFDKKTYPVEEAFRVGKVLLDLLNQLAKE